MNAPLLFALSLVALFSLITFVLGKRRPSPSPSKSSDRSSAILGATHGLSTLLALVFGLSDFGALPLPEYVGWLGAFAMLPSFAFVLWSMSTLGRWFTYTLGAQDTQPIVTSGPYQIVRHPGYLGQLAMWLSLGVASRNGVALVFIAIAAPLAYVYRIEVEEKLLLGALGDRYSEYAKTRSKLLPFVY